MAVTASVVVATYKRPDHVRQCLDHLSRQTVRPSRIIVVDGSPDTATAEVVAEFAGVEYRRNDYGLGTLATSRAIGLADLQEEVVAFIDDDAYARPDWLAELLVPYNNPQVGAVGGRADNGRPEEETEGIGQIGLLLPDGRLTGFFAADPGKVVKTDHMIGANMSYRTALARELGGIRDLYPGTCLREDADMPLRIRRAGYDVVFTPSAVVRHMAGEYPRGRRFDYRYRYYGARNHVVLLVTALGWRDAHVRRYARTVSSRVAHQLARGVAALWRRPSPRAKVRGLLGGVGQAGVECAGTIGGVFAAVSASARLRREGSS
jgi:GT2 family glycosyltransferase